MMSECAKETLLKCSEEVTGPVIFDFVRWVLDEAMRRDIKTLYFMARDGYTPYKIANLIVEKLNLSISCRYLYCSRNSLRIPTYHLIGEEAFELLSLGGYHVTIDSLLNRSSISEETKQKILCKLEMEDADCAKPLLKRELADFTKRLKENRTYRAEICEVSKTAYPETIGYLKQEGVVNQEIVAIVDSGWTGSMQRSLRQLLESVGFSGSLIGFYFGMYAQPKEQKDGIYLTWYFNKYGKTMDKVFFCNNLFECVLSAPHGMTISYEKRGEIYAPLLADEPLADAAELIQAQITGILNYAAAVLPNVFSHFDAKTALKATKKRLRRFMVRPTRKEAEAYGCFLFDDDVKDDNGRALAGEDQVALLREYLIPARLFKRIRKKGNNVPELFWPYGTIAFLPNWKQFWYRWNVVMWEMLKYRINYRSKELVKNEKNL